MMNIFIIDNYYTHTFMTKCTFNCIFIDNTDMIKISRVMTGLHNRIFYFVCVCV